MARGGLWRRVRVLRRVVVVGDGGGGAPMRRRGGDGAREVERLQAHQKVPEIGVGLARSGLSAAARAAAELGYDGEGGSGGGLKAGLGLRAARGQGKATGGVN